MGPSLPPNMDAVAEIVSQHLESDLENPSNYHWEFKVSIYRIPEYIKKVNPKAFSPQWVSFGPYHHGEPYLSAMEKSKYPALRSYVTTCGLSVKDIVKELWDMLEDLQSSYDELDDKWKEPENFLKLMILDGCFMLQLCKLHVEREGRELLELLPDILLLENQLPMQLLDKLCSMSMPEHSKLISLLLKYEDGNRSSLRASYYHFLDMYLVELFGNEGTGWKPLQHENFGLAHEIQLATRFHNAGIKLKKTHQLEDVYFDPKEGVLSLPLIEMNNNHESILLNAMAFEKLSETGRREITSLITLMGHLMEKDEIESFNQLAKGQVLGMGPHFTRVYNSVNEYCKTPWKIWWRTTVDANFHNPWVIISTFSGMIGFALLIIQTITGVYAIKK